ncbi:hypothetical protein PVAND_016787 [Polypedilum vanderplanki]|uniref:Kazal-like domain-containing protein n=1 Tax=Polypedilum vanderplanki TaxID=319348 RepID=A0A9J6BH77_POLVA|nr:hypothetical protein PVAND_016787 [Polypedilum vanderplanki]
MKLCIILAIFTIFLIVSSKALRTNRQIFFPDDSDESDEFPNNIDYGNRYPVRPTRPTRTTRPSNPTRLTSTSSTVATSTQYSRRIEDCVEGCITRTTGEYNPVCGSDQRTYQNINRFECAVSCGYQITIARNQSCPSVG